MPAAQGSNAYVSTFKVEGIGMIRPCVPSDFETINEIINDAAEAYREVIPQDCFREPYMSPEELRYEMEHGVDFWGYEECGSLMGVMGIQNVKDVTLIRHAYVRTMKRGQGIGSRLLSYLREQTTRPILIGTWADAEWAMRFYEKHGFHLVEEDEKNQLLVTYWSVPLRQVETSVVLADENFTHSPRWQTKDYSAP